MGTGLAATSGLLDDVRDFLAGLAAELPALFGPRRAGPAKTIPFEGRRIAWTVIRDLQATRSVLREREGGVEFLRAGDDPASSRELLHAWYRDKARASITVSAARWSERMGLKHKRIALKDQRTLWGSCSRAGNLNFNWRLILAPPAILEYVVIHELAHLAELNHSRRFWSLVEAHCPDYRARRAWLREHERELRPRALFAEASDATLAPVPGV